MFVIREGASELRLLLPDTGTFGAGSIANWSSADAASLAIEAEFSLFIAAFAELLSIPIIPRWTTLADISATAADDEIVIDVDLGFISDILDGVGANPFSPPITIPFPTSMPFGAAFAEVGRSTPSPANDNKQAFPAPAGAGTMQGFGRDDLTTDAAKDAHLDQVYGGAYTRGLNPPGVESGLVWNFSPIPPTNVKSVKPLPNTQFMPPGIAMRSDTSIGATFGDKTTRVNKNYKGLPRYLDTSGEDTSLFGFGAPHVTVSLVLDEEKHDRDRGELGPGPAALAGGRVGGDIGAIIGGVIDGEGDPINHPEMAGNLQLDEAMAGGIFGVGNPKLHSLARAEVYFHRPNDLGWFQRLDDKEEGGSAFNPYWQARLVELRWADSVMALAVEQQEDFTGASEAASVAINAIGDAFTPIISGITQWKNLFIGP